MKRQKGQGKKLFFIFRHAISCSYYSPSKLCLSDELKNTELEKDNNRNDMRMKLVHISSSNLEFEPVRFNSGRFFLFLSKFSHLINHLNYSTVKRLDVNLSHNFLIRNYPPFGIEQAKLKKIHYLWFFSIISTSGSIRQWQYFGDTHIHIHMYITLTLLSCSR